MSDGSGEEEDTFYSEEGVQLVTARVKEFFDSDPKWKMEDTIGQGANGIVYRVRYRDGRNLKRIAVKICPIDITLATGNKSYDEDDDLPDEVIQLENEDRWLRVLRGCPHIINILDQADDPLAQTPAGVLPHRMRSWIFLEWAEHGSLNLLFARHTEEYPNELIPNGILWRFFMCLVRACVEMAYHDIRQADGQLLDNLDILSRRAPGNLCHTDMTNNNIVIGAVTPGLQSPEHDITPILKLIDFGGAEEMQRDFNDATGVQANMADIGDVMLKLAILGDGALQRGTVTVENDTFDTFGGDLITRYDEYVERGIDPDLIHLIFYCLAIDPAKRPNPAELAMQIHNHLISKDYNGVERETEEAMKRRIARLLFDADSLVDRKRRREDSDENSDEEPTKKRRTEEEPMARLRTYASTGFLGPKSWPRAFRLGGIVSPRRSWTG